MLIVLCVSNHNNHNNTLLDGFACQATYSTFMLIVVNLVVLHTYFLFN